MHLKDRKEACYTKNSINLQKQLILEMKQMSFTFYNIDLKLEKGYFLRCLFFIIYSKIALRLLKNFDSILKK